MTNYPQRKEDEPVEKYGKTVNVDDVLEILDKMEIKELAQGFDEGWTSALWSAHDMIVKELVLNKPKEL